MLVKKTIFFDQAAFWTKHFNFTRGNSHFHTANVAHLIIREKAFCFLCTFLAEGEYIVFFSHKELSAEGNLFASSSASWQCLRYCVTIVCVFASRPSCWANDFLLLKLLDLLSFVVPVSSTLETLSIRFFVENRKPQTTNHKMSRDHGSCGRFCSLQFTFERLEGLPALSDLRQGFLPQKIERPRV